MTKEKEPIDFSLVPVMRGLPEALGGLVSKGPVKKEEVREIFERQLGSYKDAGGFENKVRALEKILARFDEVDIDELLKSAGVGVKTQAPKRRGFFGRRR